MHGLPCCAGKGGLDNINLFSIITMMSFCILTPIAIAVEGFNLSPAAIQVRTLLRALLLKMNH